MHSSRMRTGRSLIVCCSLLPGGVWSRGGSGPGEVWSRGGLPGRGGEVLPGRQRGGFSLAGGLVQGVGGCLVLGGSPWQAEGGFPLAGGFSLADPPPVNRMTDRCKNITLATTSLRPVKMSP